MIVIVRVKVRTKEPRQVMERRGKTARVYEHCVLVRLTPHLVCTSKLVTKRNYDHGLRIKYLYLYHVHYRIVIRTVFLRRSSRPKAGRSTLLRRVMAKREADDFFSSSRNNNCTVH